MSYPDGFIPPHGNYRQLLSYRKAEIVFDITYRFCQRFLAKSDRTIDQMIQGARSGKQNILEGSKASGTSKETEIKLMGVARASLGARVWKSYSATTATPCEYGAYGLGTRRVVKPGMFGGLEAIPRKHMTDTATFAILAPLK